MWQMALGGMLGLREVWGLGNVSWAFLLREIRQKKDWRVRNWNWAVLSDEQMTNGWPFSLVNDDEQRVETRRGWFARKNWNTQQEVGHFCCAIKNSRSTTLTRFPTSGISNIWMVDEGCIMDFSNGKLGFFTGLYLGDSFRRIIPHQRSMRSQGYRTLAEAEKIYHDQASLGRISWEVLFGRNVMSALESCADMFKSFGGRLG